MKRTNPDEEITKPDIDVSMFQLSEPEQLEKASARLSQAIAALAFAGKSVGNALHLCRQALETLDLIAKEK